MQGLSYSTHRGVNTMLRLEQLGRPPIALIRKVLPAPERSLWGKTSPLALVRARPHARRRREASSRAGPGDDPDEPEPGEGRDDDVVPRAQYERMAALFIEREQELTELIDVLRYQLAEARGWVR
jgi:hypothetical protein